MDTAWLLLDDTAPTFSEFIETPIVYGDAYTILESHTTPKVFHNIIKKDESIVFSYKLKNPTTKEAITLVIDNGRRSQQLTPKNIQITNQKLTMEHQFNNTGFYDVHLMIGEAYISTYTFEVKS